MVCCGGDCNLRWTEYLSGREESCSRPEINSGVPDMAGLWLRLGRRQGIPITLDMFLNQDVVCAFRDGAPGEYPNSLAGFDCASERPASRCLSDDPQNRAGLRDILDPDGISVHRRSIKGGEGNTRGYIDGQRAPEGIAERDHFHWRCNTMLSQHREGLINTGKPAHGVSFL
jgi:hypothetical protein